MAGSNLENMINALRGNFGTMSPAEDAEIPLNPFEQAHKNLFGGVVEAPYHAAKAIGGMMDAARQAPPAGLRREDYSEDPSAPQPAQNLSDATVRATAALMGGGIPAAEGNAAGIFGGKLAKGADLPRLFKAEDMLADGWSKDKILAETGWFHNPVDNKWRFEIPDNRMKFNSPFNLAGEEGQYATGPVKAFIDHPELLANYPQLGEGQFHLTSGPKSGMFQPMYNSNDFHMEVQAPHVDAASGIAVHELQHAVQNLENFGRGSTPREFAAVLEDDLRKQHNLTSEEFKKAAQKAYNAYWKTSGEVEARNSQLRQPLSQQVRNRYILPWETQEVPYKDQIYMNGPLDPILKALRGQ